MKLRIGDYTYSASQLEKAIPAMAGAISYPETKSHVQIEYVYLFHQESHWRVGAYSSKCSPSVAGVGHSPWSALCDLVRNNAAEFKKFGIEVTK